MCSDYAEDLEPWQHHHARAMACCDLEDWLDLGNSISEAIFRVRHRRGVTDHAVRQEIVELYQDWLKTCLEVLACIEMFVQRGYHVQGAEPFRQHCEEAKAFLKEHRAAEFETRIGLRDLTLCPEAAEQLTQILDDTKNSAPRPTYPPRSVPLVDAAVLRRR
jgi:hypothetical protein